MIGEFDASFPNLEGLALGTGSRQTRDGDRLVPQTFLVFWTWKDRRGNPGRPRVSRELRDLGSVAHEPSNRNQEPDRTPSGDGCFNDCIG